MDKTEIENLLYDIKPSRLRLKQIEYQLLTMTCEGAYPVTNWEREGRSYDISNPTEKAVERVMDKKIELESERAMLRAKLALYDEWVGCLGDNSLSEIVDQVYINCKNPSTYMNEYFIAERTFYNRRDKLIQILANNPIKMQNTVA